MYKKYHYILFSCIQIVLSILVFFIFNNKTARDAILVYAYQVPIWALFTYYMLPKTENKNGIKWQDRFFFCFFLGFGLSVIFLILLIVIIFFFSAVFGANLNNTISLSFIPLHSLSIFISTWFFSKEITRLKYFGLDYRENIQLDDTEDDFNIDKDKTMEMFTVLDLRSNATIEELKKRYFDLSKIYHPDRLNGLQDKEKKTAEREFRRIKKAYEAIKKHIKKN